MPSGRRERISAVRDGDFLLSKCSTLCTAFGSRSAFAYCQLRGEWYFGDMPRLLESKEIKEALKDLPEWEQEGKTIERSLEFDDFSQAIDFVNGVAELAEDAEHHPDIDIRYNKVRVMLTTHSKGGLTDSDIDLAEKIDTLVDG